MPRTDERNTREREKPPTSPWVGTLLIGIGLVILGIVVAVATYAPPGAEIHPAGWALTLTGSGLIGVSVGSLP